MNSELASTVDYQPFTHYLSVFGWIAFVVSLLSIAGSLYILLYRLKFSPSALVSDHHFRLRFLLAVSLFINRSSNLVEFVFNYRKDAIVWFSSHTTEIYLKSNRPLPQRLEETILGDLNTNGLVIDVAHTLQASSLYCMMAFLLFLTLDRYKRIHMILPGTRKYYYFKFLVIIYSILVLYISFIYGLEWLSGYFSPEKVYARESSQLVSDIIKYRTLIELVALSTGMMLYYYYTCRLILTSIQGVKLSFKCVWESLLSKHKSTSGRPSLEHDQPIIPLAANKRMQEKDTVDNQDMAHDQLVIKDAAIIHKQKIRVAVKMITYFLLVILIDVSIFSMMILVNTITLDLYAAGVRHVDVMAFVSSWIVFHVLIIYELLDLFLKQLKKAKMVQQVEEAKKDLQIWNYLYGRFHGSASHDTEPVDLDLIESASSKVSSSKSRI